MKTSLRVLSLVSCMAVVLAAAPNAHAVTISGKVFDSQSGNVPLTSAGVPAGDLAATFTVTALHLCDQSPTFCPGSGNYTLGSFLASDGATGITYLNGQSAASTLNNTLWEFTGTAFFTNGQMFTVAHDDGTVMYVNGALVLNVPGPTVAATDTFVYNGPTGMETFDFLYGEVQGTPAVYNTNLVDAPATPEPNSLVLLGTGILGAAGMLRRRIFA